MTHHTIAVSCRRLSWLSGRTNAKWLLSVSVLSLGLATGGAVLAPRIAAAQVVTDPGAIATCLCLQDAMTGSSAEMAAKTGELSQTRQELAGLDRDVAGRRAETDVNNPEAVARFKQLLERRDAAYNRASGPLLTSADESVARYNGRVNEYNARCANRAFDPVVSRAVRATLTCPPLQ